MIITEFGPQETLTVRRPPALGRVYYVDHFNGLDTNNGIDPGTPFLTITHALGVCVANRNDYIVVLDCWAEATETWPIPVSVDRVHIVGMASPTGMYTKIKPPDATNTATFYVTGDYCEIAGFDIGSGDDHGGIELAQGRCCWIHHCSFGSTEANKAAAAPLYGIWIYADSNLNCLIEDCQFRGVDGNALGVITIDGITTRNAPGAVSFGRSVVRNNIFRGLPGCGIYLDYAAANTIKDNVFALDDDTQGAAITLAILGGVNYGNLIVGNKAMFGDSTAALGTNPYLDNNGADANHWVGNMAGNGFVDPD